MGGLLTQIFIQAVITSCVLGALKRAGVIRVEPRRIEHGAARDVFTQAVDAGEVVAAKAERLLREFQRK